jgi:hypothetical protein
MPPINFGVIILKETMALNVGMVFADYLVNYSPQSLHPSYSDWK